MTTAKKTAPPKAPPSPETVAVAATSPVATVAPPVSAAPAVKKVDAPVKAARAAKPAAKPVAKPVVKPAAKAAGKAAVKAPRKPAAPPRALPKAPAPQMAKDVKAKKPKMVRDSFTIPKPEYAVLDELKQRAAELARTTKKSELLRAGIKALAAMNAAAFLAALDNVPAIKTGRPKKG